MDADGNRRIEKVCYEVVVGEKRVDHEVYGGALLGLCTAEVEFISQAAAGAFTRRRGSPATSPASLAGTTPRLHATAFRAEPADDCSAHDRRLLREIHRRSSVAELPDTRYVDRKGREKRVRYWAMTVVTGRFRPNREVDEVRWATIAEAAGALTYPRDVAVVRAMEARFPDAARRSA